MIQVRWAEPRNEEALQDVVIMDRQTRNLIQKATQDARHLLESEFAEQLEGIFDIFSDGHIASSPGEHLNAEQCIIRGKIVAAVEHEKAGGVSDEAGSTFACVGLSRRPAEP